MEMPPAPFDGAGDVSPQTSAERMLTVLYPVCSHDLPNQILSLQSLINLMDMDEAERLDATGLEYLGRLKAVAEKTAGIVDFLKAMIRLSRYVPQPREFALADAFRELKAEAGSMLVTPLAWDIRVSSVSVRADYGLVSPSLADLLRALAEGLGPRSAKTVTVMSAPAQPRTIVEMVVGGPGLHKLATMLDKRCDYLLARERLQLAGVDLRLGPARVDEASVILEFAAERS